MVDHRHQAFFSTLLTQLPSSLINFPFRVDIHLSWTGEREAQGVAYKNKKKKKESRRGGSSRGRARCATDGLLDAETKKVGIGFYVGETTTTHFPSRCFTHTKRNVVADCPRGFRLDGKEEELSRVGKPFFPIREPIDRSRTARRGEYYRRAK